jgi:protoporphyrinogen oxidase
VPEAPLDDVLRASLGLDSEGYTHQSSFYYPRRGGFEALVTGFAQGIEDRIRTRTPVKQVLLEGPGFEVNGERFERVVNTMPLKLLFPLMEPQAPPEVADALAGLRHLSLATVLVAVNQERLAPYSWVYLPHPENGPVNRLTFLSNYSPHNAPQGCSSILAEVTLAGEEPPPDLPKLERQVVEHFIALGIVPADKLRFTTSRYNEYAYPVYDLEFRGRITRVLEYLESQGLVSLGRFARYSYVNTDQVYMMVRDALAEDFEPLE